MEPRHSNHWQTTDAKLLIGAPIWQKNAALPLPLDALRRGARLLTAPKENAGAAPAPRKENG
jgi:hypothetical protein